MRLFRYDAGAVDAPVKMSDGRLRTSVRLTRTGVFRYRNADGTERREYRPPEEVFKPESMRSAEMMPFTDDHPPIHLDSKTATAYTKGSTGETIKQDGKYLSGSVVVFDAQTIRKMESGKREVSCGYWSDFDPTPGVTPDGEHYDGIQRNIEYNHLALVDRGRAGSDVRVRMDAAIMITDEINEGTTNMKELVEALAAKAAAEARAISAEQNLSAEKARADKAEAQCESIKKDLAIAEKARKDSEDSFSARVRSRAQLELTASKFLRTDDDKPVDTVAMSDREIRVAIVKRIDGDDLGADKSEDWVAAAFEGAVKRADRGSNALSAARVATESTRNDASNEDSERAAARKMDEARNKAFAEVKGY